MQRLPGAFLFVFTYAKRVLGRVAHSSLGNFLRFRSADIDDQQAQCTSNGCVGAKTVPKRVMAAVHPNGLSDGAVNDGEWSGREGGHIEGMGVKFLITQR